MREPDGRRPDIGERPLIDVRIFALSLLLILPRPLAAQAPQVLPTISPFNAETVTLRELAAIIAERDRQYIQAQQAQQQAVNSALAAQDKATAAAFAAAEKAVAAALAAQERATAAAFSAANAAVSKAEIANEKRLDGVNEFRGQLKDQAALLATRTEVATQFRALSDKLDTTAAGMAEMRSRWDGAATLWAILAVIGGLVIGIFGLSIVRQRQASAAAHNLNN